MRFQTAVFLGLLVGSWIVADPLTAIARIAPMERAEAAMALAPLGASEIEAIVATPIAIDVANLDASSFTEPVGARSAVDGKAGLVYAQLAVVLGGLLLVGTGVFLVANRAQLRDAIGRG